MKVIEDKNYYKMSELVEATDLSNHITVLNLIKYFKENLNFSIDYIKELFDYYNINFEDRADLIIQSIQIISNEIKNPISKNDLEDCYLQEAIELDLVDDKEIYFKTEVEVLKTFSQLRKYKISTKLIKEYVSTSKKLASLERELSDKVLEETGFLPEILVLDILNSFKPYIFNRHTIEEFKKDI